MTLARARWLGATLAILAPLAQAADKTRIFVDEGGGGRLEITGDPARTARFSMSTVGGNFHTCETGDGEIHALVGTMKDEVGDGEKCRIVFVPTRGGFEAQPNEACLQYCGARARLEGVYLPLPAQCEDNPWKEMQTKWRAAAEAGHYGEVDRLLSQRLMICAKQMSRTHAYAVLLDLALAEHRENRDAACRETLAPLAEWARAPDEDVGYGAVEHDVFMPFVKGARSLFRLCGASGEAAAREEAQAITNAQSGATKGDAQALGDLADRFETGAGVFADAATALTLRRKAAETGDARAQFRLAHALPSESERDDTDSEAALWSRKAAEQGYPPAEGDWGERLAFGHGVEKDKKKGAFWLRKALADGFEGARSAAEAVECREEDDLGRHQAFHARIEARDFAGAVALYQPWLKLCGGRQREWDNFRYLNDLALAQKELGRKADCLESLAPLSRYDGKTEAQMRHIWVTSEIDAWLPILTAARQTREACKAP